MLLGEEEFLQTICRHMQEEDLASLNPGVFQRQVLHICNRMSLKDALNPLDLSLDFTVTEKLPTACMSDVGACAHKNIEVNRVVKGEFVETNEYTAPEALQT